MKVKATVYLVESTNNIKATASITIEDCFVVKGIKIIEGRNGLFSTMPNRKTPTGEYKDICFPITAEARTIINDEILKAYYEKLGQQEEQNFIPNDEEVMAIDELPF